MIAPITVVIAVTCLLLAFAGLGIAAFALIRYAKMRDLNLLIGALALILSAIALLVHVLTLLHHFS
jgi:hypothetical protein